MAFSKDALPGLFRSLKPQPETPSAAALAAAHITQQKWPIFKSIKTTQVHAPPPLSETERLHWTSPNTVQTEAPETPPPSPTAAAQTLSSGLQAMVLPPVEPEIAEEPRKPRRTATPPEIPIAVVEKVDVGMAEKPAVALPSQSAPTRPSPFLQAMKEPQQTVRDAAPAQRGDDALTQVFERLRGNQTTPPATERKPSAFLSRLGKR